MLSENRIPLSELEEEAVNRLLAREGSGAASVSLSRSEPGESGPVRVEIDDRAWLVEDSGHYRKVDS